MFRGHDPTTTGFSDPTRGLRGAGPGSSLRGAGPGSSLRGAGPGSLRSGGTEGTCVDGQPSVEKKHCVGTL